MLFFSTLVIIIVRAKTNAKPKEKTQRENYEAQMDGYTLSISTTTAISIVSFLFGTLVGHRFALWRDRRSEFKIHAEPIVLRLLSDRENPSPLFTAISSADQYLTAQMLPFWRSGGFKRACAAYHKAKSENQKMCDFGIIRYSKTTDIVRQIDALLGYLRQK